MKNPSRRLTAPTGTRILLLLLLGLLVPGAEREEEGKMKVNYYPDSKGAKGRGIVAFLEAHKVRHQLVEPTPSLRRRICGGVDLPAIEVDGRFFVNPNKDALRKILRKG